MPSHDLIDNRNQIVRYFGYDSETHQKVLEGEELDLLNALNEVAVKYNIEDFNTKIFLRSSILVIDRLSILALIFCVA